MLKVKSVHSDWFILAKLLRCFCKRSTTLAFHSLLVCVAAAGNVHSGIVSVWVPAWSQGCTDAAHLQGTKSVPSTSIACPCWRELCCGIWARPALLDTMLLDKSKPYWEALAIPFVSTVISIYIYIKAPLFQRGRNRKEIPFFVILNVMAWNFCFGKKFHIGYMYWFLFSFSGTEPVNKLFPWP